MLRTSLTERYALEIPFVAAGMGFICAPPLVAAVCNAGGLGLLACGASPASGLHDMIRTNRRLTDRVFGVNFIVKRTQFGPLTTEEHIQVCI